VNGSDRLPRLDFVAVGPMRAGTTWLHANLAAHPRIRLPRGKETFFFDRHYSEGITWYAAHFPPGPKVDGPALRFGEVGASYFDVPEAPARIAAVAPGCRIVVSVRDPVERAWSAYLHYRKRGRVPVDLHKAILKMPKIVEASRYSAHLPRWERAFGRERVLLASLDDIRSNPDDLLTQVCAHFGVDPLPVSRGANDRVNKGFIPTHPWIQRGKQEAYRFLRRHHLYGALRALGLLSRAMADLRGGAPMVGPLPERSARDTQLLNGLLSAEGCFLRDRGVPIRVGRPNQPEDNANADESSNTKDPL